jgi:hypothetical protein
VRSCVTACHQPSDEDQIGFSIAWIFTKRHRIPAIAGTHQGPETGELILP